MAEPLAYLLLLTLRKDVHRARLTPRSRGPLVMACLSCGYASKQSQDKNEEESHGNRSAGNSWPHRQRQSGRHGCL